MTLARHEATVRARAGLQSVEPVRAEHVQRVIVAELRKPRVPLGAGRLARALLKLNQGGE